MPEGAFEGTIRLESTVEGWLELPTQVTTGVKTGVISWGWNTGMRFHGVRNDIMRNMADQSVTVPQSSPCNREEVCLCFKTYGSQALIWACHMSAHEGLFMLPLQRALSTPWQAITAWSYFAFWVTNLTLLPPTTWANTTLRNFHFQSMTSCSFRPLLYLVLLLLRPLHIQVHPCMYS